MSDSGLEHGQGGAQDPASLDRVLGYFLWPPVWIGSAPEWAWHEGDRPQLRGTPDRKELAERVVQREVVVQGATVIVEGTRDGYVAFDFSALGVEPAVDAEGNISENRALYLRVMNAHLLCLHASVERYLGVRPLTSLEVSQRTGDLTLLTSGARGNQSAELMRERWDPPVGSGFSMRSNPVSLEQFANSLSLLAKICSSPDAEELLLHAEGLLRALDALQDDDYGGALVYAWTTVEVMLRKRFRDYLDGLNAVRSAELLGDERFINADRMRFLEGSEITGRILVEILSLADRLPIELYRSILRNSKRRNNWLHLRAPVKRNEAVDAIDTAASLFRLMTEIELSVPTDRRLTPS